MSINEITWRFPWALLLALTPVLIHTLLWMRRKRLLDYAEAHLRPWAMQDHGHGPARHAWTEWMLWSLLALALAGPRIPETARASTAEQILRRDIEIMVVLDVSPHMERLGNGPSALARSKLELSDLLARLQGERIGLITFSGTAGLIVPPTYDYELFTRFLDLADATMIEGGASNMAAALDLAQQVIVQRAPSGGAILLVSADTPDAVRGERGAQALSSAQSLKQKHIRLAILNAAQEGQRDAAALTELAEMANGKIAEVEDSDQEWRTLYGDYIRAIPSRYKPPRNSGQWIELYPWLLLPAALLVVISFAGFPLRSILVLALGLLPASLRAEVAQPEAYNAFRTHDYARAQLLYAAQPGYTARFGEGASAYRRKDYEYAVAQFALALIESRTSAQRADALFNLANARFMQGRYEAAMEAYRDAKRYRDNDVRIEHNYQLAAARLGTQRRARSEGVPGRRGAQVGGRQGEDITDRPAGMEEDKNSDPWMSLDNSTAAQNAMRGNMAGSAKNAKPQRSNVASPEEARVAAKKIEMLRDEPKALLTTLVKFEEQRRRNVAGEK